MSVHHGGRVSKAVKNLASNSTSKSTKREVDTVLANHKAESHYFGWLEPVEKAYLLKYPYYI